MRIETNARLVSRNKRLATVMFFVSMAVLIGGFFLITATQGVAAQAEDSGSFLASSLLSTLVLPASLICTIFSVRLTNLWLRQPRPEEAIKEGLKGISKKSTLYNYYHFPARHVLISPQGVFAIVTRFQEGKFSVEGDKWKTAGGALTAVTRFFRQDHIANPTHDALRAAEHVQKLLDSKMPGVHVQPLIIFVDPRAQIEAINPQVPVLYADERKEPNLRDYLREISDRQTKLSEEQVTNAKAKKKPGKPAEEVNGGALDAEAVAEAFDDATAEVLAK
ncbi:MAG TPA: nuclease-related domain-containing protein [Aggregatilineales bacterium]|nr:NERD domain-containing protein [Anaerolineae bacterium]HUN10154.1 nuclease-related domain-containing protein [Aggregatilineales bacterium]